MTQSIDSAICNSDSRALSDESLPWPELVVAFTPKVNRIS